MKRVIVLEEAAEDIEAARDFYDDIEQGVGDYFVRRIVEDIERLASLSGIHGMHFGFHRMLSEKFPFGIYYRENANETQVFAILDLRREPTWIRSELHSRNS
jgi:plasmid stabilization system protein ParE